MRDNTATVLTCAGCGEESTNPGQFMDDGRWVCSHACKLEVLVCLSMNDGVPQDENVTRCSQCGDIYFQCNCTDI